MNPFLNVTRTRLFFGKERDYVPLGVTVWIDPSSDDDFFDVDRCRFFDSLDFGPDPDTLTPFDYIKLEYDWIEKVREQAGRSTYREIFNCIAHALEHVDGVVICSPNRSAGDNVSFLFCQIDKTLGGS